jgi:hypothetical protein
MEIKNKDGSEVILVNIKKVKLPKRGKKHLLEKIPMYSDGKEWFYDKKDVENIINDID